MKIELSNHQLDTIKSCLSPILHALPYDVGSQALLVGQDELNFELRLISLDDGCVYYSCGKKDGKLLSTGGSTTQWKSNKNANTFNESTLCAIETAISRVSSSIPLSVYSIRFNIKPGKVFTDNYYDKGIMIDSKFGNKGEVDFILD